MANPMDQLAVLIELVSREVVAKHPGLALHQHSFHAATPEHPHLLVISIEVDPAEAFKTPEEREQDVFDDQFDSLIADAAVDKRNDKFEAAKEEIRSQRIKLKPGEGLGLDDEGGEDGS